MIKRGETTIAVLVTVIALGAYLYLFGFADRKIVFLYGHLGLAPFDTMTKGRYWMAGLVVSGFLTMFYFLVRLTGRFAKTGEKISWKAVVKFSAMPLIPGVVLITMNVGEPELTFPVAMGSALALTIGIALGFSVADDLITDYRGTFIYLASGLGLVPFLVLFRALELPGKGILSMNVSLIIVATAIAGGFCWLLASCRIFRRNRPGVADVIKGTLATGYVVLPVVHFLAATPKGIPYITSADNFFADSMMLRITNWVLLLFIVLLADKITNRKVPGS